jgi:hypothetical protein
LGVSKTHAKKARFYQRFDARRRVVRERFDGITDHRLFDSIALFFRALSSDPRIRMQAKILRPALACGWSMASRIGDMRGRNQAESIAYALLLRRTRRSARYRGIVIGRPRADGFGDRSVGSEFEFIAGSRRSNAPTGAIRSAA